MSTGTTPANAGPASAPSTTPPATPVTPTTAETTGTPVGGEDPTKANADNLETCRKLTAEAYDKLQAVTTSAENQIRAAQNNLTAAQQQERQAWSALVTSLSSHVQNVHAAATQATPSAVAKPAPLPANVTSPAPSKAPAK
jgi:hypothetical protein